MKAITPANEIPPPQSTAASGTFPTEQTNESTATSGPTSTFSTTCSVPPWPVRKSELKNDCGSSATKPAIRKPSADLLPEHLPVAAEVVRHVRPALERERRRAAGRVVLVPGVDRLRPRAGLLLLAPRDEDAHADPHQHDQQQAADELRERELPAEEDPDHDPELEDEVRRGELEDHRRGEARALLEQRLRDRDRRVAARRRGRAEPGRERDRPAGRGRRARARAGRAAPRPARSPRAGSRARAPTRPPTPSGRRSQRPSPIALSTSIGPTIRAARYSTVTVFARLRGWSTFRPRSRAIR